MKRFLIVLALLLMLAPAAPAQEMQHVSDLAGVLSPGEEANLQRQAAELYEKTGFDLILHTTSNSQRKTAADYSMDFYHGFRSPALYPHGAMLAIMLDIREYNESTRGRGEDLLGYTGANILSQVISDELANEDYYGAFSDYLRYVRRKLLPPTPMERAVELAPFILIGGLVVGLIYAFVLKSKLKIAKYRHDAQQYVLPNSLRLTDSQDIYLYQTVTRTKIESSSGGGGGSRGGGFSSGSRGGTSYTNRGGKF